MPFALSGQVTHPRPLNVSERRGRPEQWIKGIPRAPDIKGAFANGAREIIGLPEASYSSSIAKPGGLALTMSGETAHPELEPQISASRRTPVLGPI